jgi:hypothetical protein
LTKKIKDHFSYTPSEIQKDYKVVIDRDSQNNSVDKNKKGFFGNMFSTNKTKKK